MRHLGVLFAVALACLPVLCQSPDSDDATLSKARGLYDAPFTRQLVSFDCSVQFDWRKHFSDTLGTVPAAVLPTLERLQPLRHRIFVDRSGAVVSEIPTATDLSRTPHGADLESAFQAIVSSGLNAWLPFATNVILPVKPTKFNFQRADTGFKLMMQGPNASATLNLLQDMRITSVISELPQAQHFATEFTPGPDGYLLRLAKTGSGTSDPTSWDASFAYRYQTVGGFQLPAEVVVTQLVAGERWDLSLNDCKVVTGMTVNIEAPKK